MEALDLNRFIRDVLAVGVRRRISTVHKLSQLVGRDRSIIEILCNLGHILILFNSESSQFHSVLLVEILNVLDHDLLAFIVLGLFLGFLDEGVRVDSQVARLPPHETHEGWLRIHLSRMVLLC